ncbi:MAG: two-component regulator propeller domain-containing protein [Planctomycetota bacterium]
MLSTLAVVASFTSQAAADVPDLPLSRGDIPLELHVHRRFGVVDGLPSGWINDVCQDDDGYVWIATENGLSRFDGLRFATFDTRSTPELSVNAIEALLPAANGDLWIGTTRGALRRRAGRPGRFEPLVGAEDIEVRALCARRSGGAWIGGRGGVWIANEDGTCAPLEGAPADVLSLCEDDFGVLWIGTDYGLYSLREGRITSEVGDGWYPIHALVDSADGIYLGTAYGVTRVGFDGSDRPVDGFPSGAVYDLHAAGDGAVYAAATNHVALISSEGVSALECRSIASAVWLDRERGLWVGYFRNAGLDRYDPPWTGVELEGRRSNCVIEDAQGRLWVGTNEGLLKRDGQAWTPVGPESGVDFMSVRAFARSRRDDLWVGGQAGIHRIDPGGRIERLSGDPLLEDMMVQALLEDSSGALWISRRSQPSFVLTPGGARILDEVGGIALEWFHEDEEGLVWAGNDLGVFKGSADGLEPVRQSDVPALSSASLAFFDADDGLWIATEFGLVQVADGRARSLSARDGLTADHVDRVACDANGNLWIGGRHGFSAYPLRRFEALNGEPTQSLASYWLPDHLSMSELWGGFSAPKAWLASDGVLYMCGELGILTVPPRPRPSGAKTSTVLIEEVDVDGDAIDWGEGVRFSSGVRRLNVRFAAPRIDRPNLAAVRYRLDGYESEWVQAGSSRVATYTGLRPGRYALYLAAGTGTEAVEALDPALSFEVTPRLWERRSVRILLPLGLLGLLMASLHSRARRAQLRNARLEREIEERERAEEEAARNWEQLSRVSRAASLGELTTSIAHEVKQPLFAIVSNARSAQRLLDADPPDPDEAREALDDIASDGVRASEIVDHIRALVRKEHKPLGRLDLADVVREAERLVRGEAVRQGCAVRTELARDVPPVEGDPVELQQVLINLILNGLQAMDESCSGPCEVLLRLHADDDRVILSVTDHGVGIEPSRAARMFEPFYTTKPQGTGMGLAMNRAIIERHGGAIFVESTPGHGSTFRIELDAVEAEEAR